MLTNVAINALKPAEKSYKKADGGGPYLLVQPNGPKIWRFAYRFGGKQKLLSGRHYPQTTLLAARGWRKKMKHQLALGLDPSVERQKELEAGIVEKGNGSHDMPGRPAVVSGGLRTTKAKKLAGRGMRPPVAGANTCSLPFS